MDISAFIVPVFIAGILTFLAPCTLPLIPGYLGFISGVLPGQSSDPQKTLGAKRKIFLNGLFYMIGFSAVFILLGSLFGLGGAALFQYRPLLVRIGGLFIILFGLFLVAPQLPFFQFLFQERRLPFVHRLKPGNPASSLVFGATFAFGWSPCVGPLLGAALTLAASSATVGSGALLLSVFSLGLAIPFLAIALAAEKANVFLLKISKYLRLVSATGGILLILLGVLMVTNNFGWWIGFMYRFFDFINYDALLKYL